MQSRGASPFAATAPAAAPRWRCSSSAPETRNAVRSGCMQGKDARRWQPLASSRELQCSATRGYDNSARATAVQFVVRASRGSAAPGSQRVVVRGARRACAGGASGGARTSQQPTPSLVSYIAFMASHTASNASRIHGARPNPAFNRTPCGSPPLALISFWAKAGLPQGAG